jgi:myotubularin-related protein 1/2
MLGALRIVQAVARKGVSVLVHCSDGWDRTAQLSSLAMLLMDPYFRTLKGFQVLIAKEWLAFGYKFADRSGYGAEGGYNSQERSPVFMQFLDCVYQCLNQYPGAFEFNEKLLKAILEHMHSGWFGNFLFNCERERNEADIKHHTLSLWSMIAANEHMFTNQFYSPVPGVVVPIVGAKRLVLWHGWFLHWHDRIYGMAWSMENDNFIDDQVAAADNDESKAAAEEAEAAGTDEEEREGEGAAQAPLPLLP